ncbi:MAG: tetratricopeptide repeat protein [Limisphaerales bacterium]
MSSPCQWFRPSVGFGGLFALWLVLAVLGARGTTASGNYRGAANDPFSGQRPGQRDFGAPAAPQYEVPSYPVAQPQWPPPQPTWPNTSDTRVIGAQAVAPAATAVVPPSGNPRPLATHVVSEGVRSALGAVPEGYPTPERRYRNESLDRPGFFSRLFGRGGRDEAPARAWQQSAPQGYGYQSQPAQEFNQRYPVAPQPAPALAPQQDPFVGQRPTRRSEPEALPAAPPYAPRQAPPQSWGAPRGSLDAPPATLAPADERMLPPGVKPDDRRYLMYLYAKTGRADLAEPLAQEILDHDPTNKEALLAMSSLFADQKDAGRALHYATQLYRAYPESNEALYYYGAANQLAGNYQVAADVLRYLRLEKFAGKPFPYQLDLAGASEKTGNWRGQMTAYQELLDQNQVNDQTRVMVRRVLEPMQREHGDHVTAQGTAYLLHSGQLWQERLGGRTQVTDRDQLYVDASREDVLVRNTALLRRTWNDDTEGAVGWQANWSRRWITDLWVGAYQDGALGGARVMHRLPSNGAVWLEAYGNERARDGLLLNSLDGRQHRLSLAGNYLIAERFQTYGALTAREVVLGGEELAAGLQGNWGVEFLARRESPEFKVGYRGTYHANSRKSGNLALVAPAVGPGTTIAQQTQVLDSLVLHQLHREGLYADLRDRLWGPLFYHLSGSADYAFERSSMEFGGRAGLTFQPRKSLEFGTEIAYTTSAATTDGGSDAWEVGVSMKWWF